MRCPNINHKDWKALVAKVGLNQAYLEYARNNYDIPDPETIGYNLTIVKDLREDISFQPAQFTTIAYDKTLKTWLIQVDREASISNETSFKLDEWTYSYADWLDESEQYSRYKLEGNKIKTEYITEEKYYKERGLINDDPYSVKEISFEEAKNYWNSYKKSQEDFARFRDEGIEPKDLLGLNYDSGPEYDIPATEKSELLLTGFDSFYQQNEAINVMASSLLNYFRNNPDVKAGRWKKAVENFKTSVTEAKGFENILKILPELEEMVRTKLQVLGLISSPRLEGITFDEYKGWLQEDGDLDVMDEQDAINSWKDEWTFQYDSKGNALKQLKEFLAFIPKSGYDKKSKEFYSIDSFIPDQPSFMSYDEVYEQLKAILAGIDNTWEAMETELLKHQESKPFIHELLTYQIPNYNGDIDQLKRQFVSSMSASYGGFKTILVKPKYRSYQDEYGQWQKTNEVIGYYFNTIDTDQSSVEKTILAKWQGEFKRTNLFIEDEKGNLVPNKEAVNKYIEKIEKAKQAPTVSNVDSLLKAIGIEVSEATLDQIVNKNFNKKLISSQFIDEKDGLFKLIEARLKGIISSDINNNADETEEESEVNSPIVNNSAIRALARVDAQNSDNYYSNTFKDSENNTIYSYTYNKFLTKEFIKLQNDPEYVKQLLNITFNKPILKGEEPIYKSWLYELDTNPVFKNIFNISPFDGLKLASPGQDGTKLDTMSDLDLEITQLALIQNSGASKKGVGRVIKYLLTVPDKTTSYIIQGTGIDLKLRFDKDGSYTFDPTTKDALYSIAASEHNRILSQQARKSANKAYNKGSSLFYFFPTLNKDQSPELYNEDGTIKLPTTLIGKISIEQYIRNKIEGVIRGTIKEKVTSWENLGIIDKKTGLKFVDSNYKKEILDKQIKDSKENTLNNEVTLAAADYVIQSMLAKFNTHQTFIDDPAVYYKNSVDGTWANIGKRLTNLIAPFKDGMIDETNKNFLSIKLQDATVSALNNAQLQARLKSYYEDRNIKLPYDEITGTDAQEYTTLREHIKVLYMYGELSTKTYNNLIAKINKEGDDLVLNPEEIELFLTAVKPVYSSRQVDANDDAVYREYIKSSSIPLLPQFTKGLELDKLRRAMEKAERSQKFSVRAVFDTGTKLGGKGSVNIWNSDGTIKDDIDLLPYAVTLDRSNFGIQQATPYDETKDEVVKSTQETKLLFDALQGLTGFKFDGKQYSGDALQEIYVDLHKQLYEKGLAKLESELVKNGQLDKVALSNLLLNEGQRRGYTPAQLSFLKLNPEKTDFEIPFWSHISNDKEQALITSFYTNRILKQKMPGSSMVLVSEEGTKGKSVDVVYSAEYDPATGLKPMRIVYRKGDQTLEEADFQKLSKIDKEGFRELVKPAQILIPFNIRNKQGKLLNRKDFINEEGFIDTKKLPKEILTTFGFRIPNSGQNSMSLIEVVGFLSDSYRDIVIASRNFITQMGSDFDVDKLYMYNFSTEVDKDHKVTKEEDNIQNRLLDMHKSVLYNPKVFKSVVKPVDLGELSYTTLDGKKAGIAEELKALQTIKLTNYLDPDYAKNKYLQSIDGKAMVGINAVGNTFLALIQGKGMYLQFPTTNEAGKIQWIKDEIVFSTESGNIIKLSDLSSPFTINGKKKNEIKASYLQASVDNGNNPILSYLNHNPQTAAVEALLIALGLEEELSLFSAQPIIIEYVNRVKQSKSSLSDVNKREEEILLDLLNENKKEQAELITKFKDQSLDDLPIGPKHFRQVLHKTKPEKVAGLPELTNKEIQVLTLLKFAKIQQYGDIYSKAQGLINIDSKGLPKSLLELSDKRDKVDKLLKRGLVANLNRAIGEVELNENKQIVLDIDTISGHAIEKALFSADDTISRSNLMPFGYQSFTRLVKKFEEITNRDATPEQKYEIWKAIKSFTYAGMFPDSERERIFFDRNGNKSLNTRIHEALKGKLRNNPFLLRLDLSKVNVDGKLPSYVFYNASKEEDIEELEVYQGLLDLVQSKNPEIKSIGEDLIKYFYINGGNQASKEWGRYINPKMIKAIGLTEKIDKVNFHNEEEVPLRILQQLFQHKSYLAPKPLVPFAVSKDGEIEVKFVPSELVRGLSITNIFTQNRKLYQLKEEKEDGTYLFQELPKLGTKFYTEYQKTENIALSLLNKEFKLNGLENKTASREKIMPSDPDTESFTNPLITESIKDLLDTDLTSALTAIDSNKYNELLGDLFKNLDGILDGVKVVSINEPNTFYFGKWNPKDNTITINTGALAKYERLNKQQVESTIIKEVIHVINTKLFKGEFKATAEQETAKKSLNDLFLSIRERILTGEAVDSNWDKETFIKYQALVKQQRAQEKALTQDEVAFLTKNKSLYYGLTNVEDFMHDALLQPEFREALNKIKYSSNKTLLERIGDLIADILNAFRGLVDIRKDSALEEAFGQIFKLVSSEKNLKSIEKNEIDVVDLVLNLINQGEFDVHGDVYKLRLDLEMSTKDINKAVNDIKKRNFGTAPAKKLMDKLEAMRASGHLNYIEGAGGTSNRTQRKIDEIQYDLVNEELTSKEEKTYAKIANDFEVRLGSISKDISKAFANGDKELASTLKNRYKEVKEEKDTLIAENTFESILQLAKNDLEYVDKLLNQEDLKLNDLLYAETVLGTWTKIDNSEIYGVITDFDIINNTERKKEVLKIANTAREAQIKLTAIERGRFLELAKQETNKEINPKDITKLQDISWLQSYTRDISTSDNIVLSVTDKWIRQADFKAVTDLNKIIEKLEKLTKALQDTQAYKDKGFEGVFGQEDDNGELTGEIVDALNASYYTTRKELFTEAKNAINPILKKQAWKKYYDWVRDNHIVVDTVKLYEEDNNGIFIWKPDVNYLKELKVVLGEDYDKAIEKAKKLTEEYNEELKRQIIYYKDSVDEFKKLEAWRVSNSPVIYIDNLKNGYTSRKVDGKYIGNEGWKYISMRVINTWEDEKYNIIQKDQVLKEYYDFVRSTLDDLYHFLPYNIRKEFKTTEIPNINRDLIEELTKVGIGKSWNRTWSAFLDNISVTNNEQSKVLNPVTQDFQKDFKFDYLNKIDPDKKSYDLTKVVKLFAAQAIGYKYKAQVEDQVRLAESILREAVQTQINSNNQVATDRFGSVTTTKGLKNLYNQFDYAFEAFYGHKKDQREGVTRLKFMTPKDKESYLEEVKRLKDLKLPEAQEAAAINAAHDRFSRKVSWGRVGDTLLQYIQLKGMGWNVFAGVNNAIFGQMANFNWAAGKVDFDDKDMLKAVGVMLSLDSDTTKKVRALMTKFNTVKQLRDLEHKATSNYNKALKGIKNLGVPYALYQHGEFFVQGQVMVALMNATKVEVTEKGEKKTISLFEALNNEGEWDSTRFGENPEWANTSKKTLNFKNRLDDLLKKIHGNYDPNAPMLSNKKFIGRALTQFRRWIPEGVAQRFDSEKYDIHLQRNTEGRYRTYGQLGFLGSLNTLLKQVIYRGNDKAFDGLTDNKQKLETIKENMRKNLREIYYWLSLAGVYLALGIDDDDTEFERAAKIYSLNTVLRLQDDIEFYYSPIAAQNITRSILPVATIIVDADKFRSALVDTIQGNGEYKSGDHSGDQKTFWRGLRLFPGGSAIAGTLGKTHQQESYRK